MLTSFAAALVPPLLALEEVMVVVLVSLQQPTGATDGGAICYGTSDPGKCTAICALAVSTRTRATTGATAGALNGTIGGATDGATICNGTANGS